MTTNQITAKYDTLTNKKYSPVACDIIAKSARYSLTPAQIALLDKTMTKDLVTKEKHEFVSMLLETHFQLKEGWKHYHCDAFFASLLDGLRWGITEKQYTSFIAEYNKIYKTNY